LALAKISSAILIRVVRLGTFILFLILDEMISVSPHSVLAVFLLYIGFIEV
jgi:hypothetical protein